MHMTRLKCVSLFCDASNFYSSDGDNITSECAYFANTGDITMCYVFHLSVSLPNGDVLKQHEMSSKHLTKLFMKDQTIPT